MTDTPKQIRRPLRKRLRNFLGYLLIRFALWLAGLLSWRAVQRLGKALGLFVYLVARGERQKALANLRLAYGDKLSARQRREISRAVFVSLGRGLLELLSVLSGRTSPLDVVAEFKGGEHLRQVLAKGKGAIVVSPHLGNWELLGLIVAAYGYRTSVVARELYDPRLDRLLERLMAARGVMLVKRQGAMMATMRLLKANQMLGLLVDQDTRVESVFADFFGIPAKSPVGPVKLAYASGAAIIPISTRRDEQGMHHVVIEPPLRLLGSRDDQSHLLADVAAGNRVIEEQVRACPGQWVWIHERWKSRPE